MTADGEWIATFQQECQERLSGLSVTDPGAIVKLLHSIAPALDFRAALVRGGWYRLGGVFGPNGERVGERVEDWLETQLQAYDEDLDALVADHLTTGLRATVWLGKTHYWTARYGETPAAFLQLEFEELQEVLGHELFTASRTYSTPDDVLTVSPLDCGEVRTITLGPPQLRFRRVIDVAAVLASMQAAASEPTAAHRFLDAWAASSAGLSADLSHHWVFMIREHLGRYRQISYHARPTPALTGTLPQWHAEASLRGLALAQALRQFDKRVGYPMAWFFHLAAGTNVPRLLATTVLEDHCSDWRYLPERDLAVVQDWVHRAYGF